MSQDLASTLAASPRPGTVTAIGVMTLVNGIMNVLWALGLTLAMVLGTFEFGLLCATVTILPLVLGVFEIIYAARLMSNPPKPMKPAQAIAFMEICCILAGNVLSLGIGMLAFVFYSQPEVQGYFTYINAETS